ncbi:unnamed protein product [Choristocarpus tenellus]
MLSMLPLDVSYLYSMYPQRVHLCTCFSCVPTTPTLVHITFVYDHHILPRAPKFLVGAVDQYDEDNFFTTLAGGSEKVATPLLLCLVCIELSDFVFAVDSTPAVLGVSQVRHKAGNCET